MLCRVLGSSVCCVTIVYGMAPSTRAAARRTAAAAADTDSSSDHGTGHDSHAERVDVELLSCDPDVLEEQLRALDEHRGRPARVCKRRTATARRGNRPLLTAFDVAGH
jgi:hypothetical protein